MPQLTDNVGAEIGYDAYMNDGDGSQYPVALMPAKKPRLETQDSFDADVSQLSVTNLPRDYLQALRFDNRMKVIEDMVKDLSKRHN